MVFETFCTLKSHHFSLSVESVKTSFQMEILRNESPCDRERKEYILQNILRTIETAFLATREARQNENLLIGMLKFSFLSNTANLRKKNEDVRVWFARTAWNFGRLGNKQSAYFRHHLFKLSSQFFALVCTTASQTSSKGF